MQKKILLIDDTKVLAQSIADTSSMEGFSVSISNGGRHAVNIIHDLNPDLVITDLKMPEMDGIEVIRYIRNLDSFRNIPIVVLTADTNKQNESDSYEAGANLLMHKPFDEELFLSSITKLISNERE